MNQNNGNHRLSAVELIETDDTSREQTTSFYDSTVPELKPAKPIDTTRKKSWKRKLIGWSFILLLIGGGAIALYLLLRVSRVDVKVQADSRRDAQGTKPSANPANSENTLTAEAINIARSEIGPDSNASNANPAASPNSSPQVSPTPPLMVRTNYSYTGNSSPVFGPVNDASTNENNSQQTNGSTNQTAKPGDGSTSPQLQNHANSTQSIFVGEEPVRLSRAQPSSVTSSKSNTESKLPLINPIKPKVAVLPPFGTLLPLRTQGVIFTLRNNSYARLELTRDVSGDGWSLPKGTLFVGHTSGNEYDRAYVSVIGYIDPRDNKLVKLSGEVMGSDGAAGIPGKRIGVDRNALKSALRKVAASGVQVAGMMAGALGRGPIVIDGASYRLATPLTDEARNAITGNGAREFVKVQAGQPAYLMVADLPKAIQSNDAPGEDDITRAATSLTDREVMELIMFGSPDEIRAAMPLMSDEQKRFVGKNLQPENKDK